MWYIRQTNIFIRCCLSFNKTFTFDNKIRQTTRVSLEFEFWGLEFFNSTALIP